MGPVFTTLVDRFGRWFIAMPLVLALAFVPALTVLPHVLGEEDSETKSEGKGETETELLIAVNRPQRAPRMRSSPPRHVRPGVVPHRLSRHSGATQFSVRCGRPAVPPPMIC
jgi:hypothetical protein